MSASVWLLAIARHKRRLMWSARRAAMRRDWVKRLSSTASRGFGRHLDQRRITRPRRHGPKRAAPHRYRLKQRADIDLVYYRESSAGEVERSSTLSIAT